MKNKVITRLLCLMFFMGMIPAQSMAMDTVIEKISISNSEEASRYKGKILEHIGEGITLDFLTVAEVALSNREKFLYADFVYKAKNVAGQMELWTAKARFDLEGTLIDLETNGPYDIELSEADIIEEL